jgi:hypothetical protein
MIIIPANTLSAAGGYAVDNSVRFNNSEYLQRTNGTATDDKKYSLSFWVKRSKLGEDDRIFNNQYDGSNWGYLMFKSDNTIRIADRQAGTDRIDWITTQVFRDISAWYHFYLAIDTTQGTADNRVKFYVNGTQVTSFTKNASPSLNNALGFQQATATNLARIATADGGGNLFSGYMSEIVFIDGTQNAVTDFGEFDEDSGIFKPIDVSGLTFGDNGYYLNFQDSAELGTDVSGESNTYTEVNLTAIDQSTDTCTNNFATLNPLNVNPSSAGDTFSEGNLKLATNSNSNSAGSTATMAFTKGKWYAEVKYTSATAWNGVMPTDATINGDTGRMNWYQGRTLYLSGSNTANWGSVVSAGDIVGIALDMDNYRVTISQSGQWWGGSSFNQAQPHTFQALISGYDTWTFLCASGSGTSTSEWNFGSPAFAISSGNQDANGYGNMEFPIPTDYFICNTKNQSEYG